MEKDLVSILTPCYNSSNYIHRYIESILSQTYSNIELILIDDGSIDNTEEIIGKYRERLEKKCNRFVYEKVSHGGQAKAINYGLKLIRGEFLIWPDSDDYLSNDSIETRVFYLKNNPQKGFVRSNGYFVDFETLQPIERIADNENNNKSDIYLDLILEKTYCACGCYMIRTEKLFEIYPEKTIYESPAGQNWQILIPYSGRNKCGYLDENQYFITIRNESHSRKYRTIEAVFERFDHLKEILEHTIPLANRKEFDYKMLLDEKYIRKKFEVSYQMQDSNNIRKYYRLLKEIKCLKIDDTIKYCEINHKTIFRAYLLLCKVRGVK